MKQKKETTMDKKTFLILLALGGFCRGMAQTPSSVIYTYPAESSVKVLVCTNPADGNDIVCHTFSYPDTPYFSYFTQSTGAPRKFRISSIPSGVYNSDPIVDTNFFVEDMALCGDTCYFCGHMHLRTVTEFPIVEPVTRNYYETDTGFIAKFKIGDISSVNSLYAIISYVIIPGTKNITRLKTHESPDGIAAFAEMSTGETFILTLSPSIHAMYQMICPSSLESCTDFIFTNNHFVTVSHVGTPNNFGIRRALVSDVFNMAINLSTLSSLYKYDASMINTTPVPRVSPPTTMYKEVLRMIRIPNHDDFIVAYESTGGGIEKVCYEDSIHTCVFRFDGQNILPLMDIAMLVSLDQKHLGGLEDVQYTPLDDMVILKFKKSNPVYDDEGLIQYPSLTSMGNVMCQSTGKYKFTSMDVLGSVSTSFVGWDVTRNGVVHLWHDLAKFPYSCLFMRPNAYSEPMDIVNPELEEMRVTSYVSWIDWKKAALTAEPLTCKKKCETE